MNLDDHWLKERYKNESTESIEGELFHLEIFGVFGNNTEPIAMLKAEIERREKEQTP